MPPTAQRISFEGEHGTWALDGKRQDVGRRVDWTPWPGHRRLDLLAADVRVLETVRFEVRGAGIKPTAARLPAGRWQDQPRAKIRSTATSMTMPQRL